MTTRRLRGTAATLACVLALGVGGCATYEPLGLPSGPDLAATPQRLTVATARLRLQPLKSIRNRRG